MTPKRIPKKRLKLSSKCLLKRIGGILAMLLTPKIGLLWDIF